MDYYFLASPAEKAQQAFRVLTQRYGQAASPAACKCIIVLGGDGKTLHAVPLAIRHKKPIYSLGLGSANFLQNRYRKNVNLAKRIIAAEAVKVSPLHFEATFLNGHIKTGFAVNEVLVCNHNRAEGVYLRVKVDGIERIPCLGGDGLIVATSVGSTGYNRSARGPTLPLGDSLLVLTANNAFVPDRMRSMIIPSLPVEVETINPKYRRADMYADNRSIGKTAQKIKINLDTRHTYTLLFDPGYTLKERMMRAQFPSQKLG